MTNLLIDTSGWASLFIQDQTYHKQADQYFRLAIQKKHDIYTSNYVIAELVALLSRPLRIHRLQIFKIIDAIKNAPISKLFMLMKQLIL